jgi:hypothetical protein
MTWTVCGRKSAYRRFSVRAVFALVEAFVEQRVAVPTAAPQ